MLQVKSILCAAAVGTVAAGSAAYGATITYAGPVDLSGTGFGNTLTVLALQATPNESGSVVRTAGADVRSGDATNQSQTRAISELSALGFNANNLSLVLNIAEPGAGDNITLQGFTVRFTDNTGTLLFDATFAGMQTLTAVNNGIGGSGHRYNITLTAAEANQLFSSPTNRIGMLVTTPILNSAGAPEVFTIIPAPATASLAAISTLLLARRRR